MKISILKKSLVIFLFVNSSAVTAKSGVELAGDILQITIPATGASISFFKDDYTGLTQLGYTLLTSLAVTHSLKLLVPAKRPDGTSEDSFISGHTSFAMSGAAYIYFRYGYVYGIPAFLAAAFVGWSRVVSQRHHQSDVFRGTVIGILPAWYFTTRYKEAQISFSHNKESIALAVSFQL